MNARAEDQKIADEVQRENLRKADAHSARASRARAFVGDQLFARVSLLEPLPLFEFKADRGLQLTASEILRRNDEAFLRPETLADLAACDAARERILGQVLDLARKRIELAHLAPNIGGEPAPFLDGAGLAPVNPSCANYQDAMHRRAVELDLLEAARKPGQVVVIDNAGKDWASWAPVVVAALVALAGVVLISWLGGQP